MLEGFMLVCGNSLSLFEMKNKEQGTTNMTMS